jgi:hypothetical protein
MRHILYGLLLGVSLMMIFGNPYDDTDLVTDDRKERSGLMLHTDYGTGCQYLTRGSLLSLLGLASPTLYPRMGTQGEQVCIALEVLRAAP